MMEKWIGPCLQQAHLTSKHYVKQALYFISGVPKACLLSRGDRMESVTNENRGIAEALMGNSELKKS